MNIQRIIDAAFGRRHQRLEELHAARTKLLADHEAALVADDDDGAAKIHAKIQKVDADISAAEAALASAARQDEAKKRAAARAELQRLERERDEVEAPLVHLFVEIDNDLHALAAKIKKAREGYATHHHAAVEAGTPDRLPGGLSWTVFWGLLWRRFSGAIQTPDQSPLLIPAPTGSTSRQLETVADRIAKYQSDRAEIHSPTETA